MLQRHQDLQRGIDHFKEFLKTNYPELQLYREDLYYYYKHVKFNVIQVRNSIIMILHVPLQHIDLNYDLDIYRLHKIPLAVPGSNTDFTMLSSNFYAIGYNKDTDYYITFFRMFMIYLQTYKIWGIAMLFYSREIIIPVVL